MAQTIEDVNGRTILQQFHSLYNKQDAIETKVDQEKSDRQTADAGLQKLIYQEATEIGNDISSLRNDTNTNTNKIEYNATQITALKSDKQDKLTAGANITIDENNVISASGGASGGGKYQHYLMIKGPNRVHCIIENNQIDTFTVDTLKSYLTSKGYTSIKQVYPVISSISTRSVSGEEDGYFLYISNADGIYVDKDNILQLACYGNRITFNFKDGFIVTGKEWEEGNVYSFTDTVIEL